MADDVADLVVELSTLADRQDLELGALADAEHTDGATSDASDASDYAPALALGRITAPACELSQRLLAADERSQMCYWFQISEQLQRKINGSLERSSESSSRQRERLVEAELHVFKLLPQLLSGQPRPAPAGRRNGQDEIQVSSCLMIHDDSSWLGSHTTRAGPECWAYKLTRQTRTLVSGAARPTAGHFDEQQL